MRKIFLKILVFPFLGILSVFSISCDFESPSEFEMPTWYVDIQLPLLQERYDLEGMVDSIQIFPTPDSIGMQLVFEDTLPTTSIDPDWLEVNVNHLVEFETDSVMNPELDRDYDTLVHVIATIHIDSLPTGLTYVTGEEFFAPPDEDTGILASSWNAFAETFEMFVCDEMVVDCTEY